MTITAVNADAIVADLHGRSAAALRAAVWSMNRAIVSGRAVMAREIARDLGMGVGSVKDAMPERRATIASAEAAFAAKMKRIPLLDFRASGPEPSRGKGRGVSYRLPTGRGRLPNAFIVQMQSTHRGVFVRSGKAGIRTGRIIGWRKSKGAWSFNLPIHELFGPSLGHVFAKFQPMGLAATREAFDTAFAHEWDRLTKGTALAEGAANG